ncbi:MAG: DUF933 domain-containing protein, partial [Patescibacteria group bacterium]
SRTGDTKLKKKLEGLYMIKKILSEGKLAREYAPKNDEEEETLRELHLLTAKPIIYVFNTADSSIPEKIATAEHGLTFNIKLEDEISQLGEEAGDLKEMSRIDALIKKAYETVGLITFLTTGEDETRAWAIPKNSTAPRAGRAIHSDFEEKFIRAEVIGFENLVKAGSYAKARELGLLQTKGKDYIVQDGDVVEFRI